jgi:hypothetical protein
MFIALLAPITWRFFRTAEEMTVGIFLIAACAVHSAGGAYSLFYQANTENILFDFLLVLATWVPLFYACVLIVHGIDEHRRFRELVAQLEG